MFSKVVRRTNRAARTSRRQYAKSTKSVTIKFEQPYKLYTLDKGPEMTATTNRDELMSYFKEMVYIRRVEIEAQVAYTQRLIRGFLHLYNGQEAVCTGLESALEKDDAVITAYRCHGWMLTKRCGGTGEEVLAELMGRQNGCSHGKGGSMHMYKVENNFFGGNGIVGAQIPLGTGIAYAQKFKGKQNVTLSAMGDGAANQGQVYEAFNMAKIYKLPCVYLVENNLYAMGTPVERASATSEFYTRGHYIPGIQFDGMNVLQSRETMKFAKKYALEHGPILLEAMTYRYQGHSMSDPGTTYRTRDEVENVKNTRDPIAKVHHWLVDNNLASADELKEIESEIKAKAEKEVAIAKAGAWPAASELFTHVLAEEGPVRGTELVNGRR